MKCAFYSSPLIFGKNMGIGRTYVQYNNCFPNVFLQNAFRYLADFVIWVYLHELQMECEIRFVPLSFGKFMGLGLIIFHHNNYFSDLYMTFKCVSLPKWLSYQVKVSFRSTDIWQHYSPWTFSLNNSFPDVTPTRLKKLTWFWCVSLPTWLTYQVWLLFWAIDFGQISDPWTKEFSLK